MTDSSDTPVEVRHDESGHRFHGFVEGEQLALLTYSKRGEAFRLDHTEVDPSARDRGIGEAFVRGVLDDLRSTATRITVICPFVNRFIDRNPEYRDLMR